MTGQRRTSGEDISDLLQFLRAMLHEDAETLKALLHSDEDLPSELNVNRLIADVEAKDSIVQHAEDAFDDDQSSPELLWSHERILRHLASTYDTDMTYRVAWYPNQQPWLTKRKAPRSPEQRYYEIVDVVDLPAVGHLDQPSCMAGSEWRRQLRRWLGPRPRRRDCCFFHSIDWQAVADAAVRYVHQAQRDGMDADEVEGYCYMRANDDRFVGDDFQGIVLLVGRDSGIEVVDDDPARPWIFEGRHRITALRDAGVPRTVLSRHS